MIGIFDSGVGGLTLAGAIRGAFPTESVQYVGDTAHFPYGEKSEAALCEYSEGIAEFLLSLGCRLVVIACNSASAAAGSFLQQRLQGRCPVVDVIQPLVRETARQGFRRVGVIATKATIRSGIYERELHRLCPQTQVVSLATPLFAPMIEEGFFGQGDAISKAVVERYLSQPQLQGIDALLLACTHYPLIRSDIEAYLGASVRVLDSVDAAVSELYGLLDRKTPAAPTAVPPDRFFVSDYTPSFEQTARIFYPGTLRLERVKWAGGRLVLKD